MSARVSLLALAALLIVAAACSSGLDAETRQDGRDMADALTTLGFCSTLDTPRCDTAFDTVVRVCVVGQGSSGGLKPFCERFEEMLPVPLGSNELLLLSFDISEYIGD